MNLSKLQCNGRILITFYILLNITIFTLSPIAILLLAVAAVYAMTTALIAFDPIYYVRQKLFSYDAPVITLETFR